MLKGKIFSFVLEMLETHQLTLILVPESTRMRTLKDKGWLLVLLHKHHLHDDESCQMVPYFHVSYLPSHVKRYSL